MGVVAVRTLHKAFIDPVLKWHRELRPHVCMTVIAKLLLLARKQKFGNGRAMNRMAV